MEREEGESGATTIKVSVVQVGVLLMLRSGVEVRESRACSDAQFLVVTARAAPLHAHRSKCMAIGGRARINTRWMGCPSQATRVETHHSPLELPRESPRPLFLSRPEFWPAAAEAKLDGKFELAMVNVKA